MKYERAYNLDFKNVLNLKDIKRIHFIGISGVGMSGLACILVNFGYQITGSDLIRNDVANNLIKLGIKINFNHQASNVNQVDIVVISSAINLNNPEVIAAKKLHIPVIKRAKMLAELMKLYFSSIAVAGTHGKTTTTTMIIDIFLQAGLNPTFINGGLVKSVLKHAYFGCKNYLITEADESDASFLYLKPMVQIVTNIDYDHVNMYHGKFSNLKKAFICFLKNTSSCGYVILCIDDPIIRTILPKINKRIITYGFSRDADFRISNYHQYKEQGVFRVYQDQYNFKRKLEVTLNIPGKHNALNSTAAIITAVEEGIDDYNILKSLVDFQGTSRRFENLGNYFFYDIYGRMNKILIIDDYGHHPKEIHVTIKTIRIGWPEKRLVMLFQPHRFTRTRDLFQNFISVLLNVDFLLILDIYPAGEKSIFGLNSQVICNKIREYRKINSIYISNFQTLLKVFKIFLKNNDLLLIQGAGTIREILHMLFDNKILMKIKNLK